MQYQVFCGCGVPPNDVVPRDGQLMQMERRGEASVPGLGTVQTPDPGT